MGRPSNNERLRVRDDSAIPLHCIGKHVDNATEYVHAFRFRSRTTSINGRPVVVSPEVRTDRINFHVDRDVVVRAYFG